MSRLRAEITYREPGIVWGGPGGGRSVHPWVELTDTVGDLISNHVPDGANLVSITIRKV